MQIFHPSTLRLKVSFIETAPSTMNSSARRSTVRPAGGRARGQPSRSSLTLLVQVQASG